MFAYECAYIFVYACVLKGWLGRLAEVLYYTEVDTERYIGELEEAVCTVTWSREDHGIFKNLKESKCTQNGITRERMADYKANDVGRGRAPPQIFKFIESMTVYIMCILSSPTSEIISVVP